MSKTIWVKSRIPSKEPRICNGLGLLIFYFIFYVSVTKCTLLFSYNIIYFEICISNSSKNSLTLSLREGVEIIIISKGS